MSKHIERRGVLAGALSLGVASSTLYSHANEVINLDIQSFDGMSLQDVLLQRDQLVLAWCSVGEPTRPSRLQFVGFGRASGSSATLDAPPSRTLVLSGSGRSVAAAAPDSSGGDAGNLRSVGRVLIARQVGARWTLAGSVGPARPREFGRFGISIALSGTTLAVASAALINAPEPVKLYELEGVDVREFGALTPPTQASAAFGSAVLFHGGDLLVGDPGASPRGAVHRYRRDGDRWTVTSSVVRRSTGSEIGEGLRVETRLARFGSVIAAADTLVAIGGPGLSLGDGWTFPGAIETFSFQPDGSGQWLGFAEPQGGAPRTWPVRGDFALVGSRLFVRTSDGAVVAFEVSGNSLTAAARYDAWLAEGWLVSRIVPGDSAVGVILRRAQDLRVRLLPM